MKWLLVGAGAIGSLVGGRLARAGHQVMLVVRPHVVGALRRGLTLVSDGERGTVEVAAVADLAEAFGVARSFDVVALTMKAFAVGEAAEALRNLDIHLPPLLTFQNGVGSEEIVRKVLPEVPLMAASISVPAETLAPGIVRGGRKGGIALAPVHGDVPLVQAANALREAGFPVRLISDYRAMKWSKLLLNMLGNATSAIVGWPPERIFAHPGLFWVEHTAWQEARLVMRSYGIPVVRLPGYPVPLFDLALRTLPPWLLRRLAPRLVGGGRGGKMPSLYLDLEAGRRQLEIDFLNGAVVRYGDTLGIPTPVNATLTEIVQGLAAGTVDRQAFRDRPERLVERVRAGV